MDSFNFNPHHLSGRVTILEGYWENLKALNEVVYLQVDKTTEEGDEDAITFIGLVRLVEKALRDMGDTLQELREIMADGLEKERKARAAAKAQGKEG